MLVVSPCSCRFPQSSSCNNGYAESLRVSRFKFALSVQGLVGGNARIGQREAVVAPTATCRTKSYMLVESSCDTCVLYYHVSDLELRRRVVLFPNPAQRLSLPLFKIERTSGVAANENMDLGRQTCAGTR